MNITNHKGRWTKVVIALIVLAILVCGGIIVGVRRVYQENLKPAASNQKSVTITIPQGYSLGDVASLLKKLGIIKSEWAFSQYVRDKQADADIKAGTYELSPSQSVQEIVSIITLGKIKTDLITILPGQRLSQVRARFISSGFTADSVDAALNTNLYTNHPALVDKPSGANLEGYLYPDSYQRTSNTKPEDIIEESLNEMQKQLTPDIRAAINKQGLNVYQGIILASMVEQEANKPTDRNKVAQVFLSRLHSNLRLESDVTAFYGSILADQPRSVAFESLYNTYLHDGLPVGPISNVSSSSLRAVAYPANTSYLYFVAGDDDGTVYFSHTLQEHHNLIRQYCPKNCAIPSN